MAFLQTLRAQFLLVVAVALLPLIGLTVWRVGGAVEQRRRDAAQDVLSLARQSALHQREVASGAKAMLVALAESPILRENDLARCDRFVRDVTQAAVIYAVIGVADLEGRVVCASTGDRRLPIADRVYFREAIASEDFAVGEYVVGRNTSRESLHFAYPVREATGRLRGVVYAGVDLERLQEGLEMRSLPDGAVAMITDRRGVILARVPDGAAYRGKKVSDEEFRMALANLGQAHGPAALGGTPARIYAFATPSGPAQGRIYAEVSVPWDELVAAGRRDLLIQLGVLAVAALAALLCAHFVGEVFLLRTADVLARTARRLGGGDYSARTGLAGRGELAEAGRALDDTAAALERQRDAAAEAASRLREKTLLLSSVLDGMDQSILAVDAAGKVVLVNRAARALHGSSAEETSAADRPGRFGLYRPDGTGPLAPDELPSMRTLKGEIVREEEVLMRPPGGGREVALRVNTRPLVGDDGRIEGALVMMREVTDVRALDRERRLAIAGRERAEEELKSLFEANPLPALIYDADSGQLLDANKEAERLYGLEAAKLRGTPFTRLRSQGGPGALSGAPALEPGQRLDWLERHRVGGGAESDLHFVGRGVTFAGRRAVVVTANDMAHLLKLERDLRRSQEVLLESQRFAGLGNWEIDLASGRVYLSDAIRDYVGIAPVADGEMRYGFMREVDAAAWQGALGLIHPDDRARHKAAREAAVAGGAPLDIEYRVHAPGRGERWVHAKGEMERDGDGKPVRFHGIVQDVTARRHADESLLLLRAAVSGIRDTVLITTATRVEPGPRIVFVNEAFRHLTGWDASEVLGRSPRVLQSPKTDAVALARIGAALRNGDSVHEELLNVRKDGTEYWVEIEVFPMKDAQGATTHFVAVQRDVTERREAERELREREARYRLIFRDNPLPMWVFDRNTLDFLDVNDAAVAKYGWSREEFLSMKVSVIRPLEQGSELLQRLAELGPGVKVARPFRHRLRDGREIVIDSIAHDIEFMGRPARFACPVDVTERLQAEEAVLRANAELESRVAARTAKLSGALALQKALFDNAPQMIWTADAAGAITYMSRAWHDLVGGAPADWMGWSWLRAAHAEDAARVEKSWRDAIASGQLLALECRFRSKDGRYRDFQMHASPVRGEGGAVISWVGLSTDITERKRAEEALRLSNQELEAFSYSVSHDLRSPLQAIDGFSNAVVTDYADRLDEQGRRYLERIRASAQRMAQLIEDMLQLARVSRAQMVPVEVDLSAEAQRIVEELAAQDPGRVVKVEIAPGLVALGDRALLRQVLVNLLGNAWKFTAKKGDAVIRFGRERDPDREVFAVSDNGAGFDMRYAGKLFGVFQRLHTQAEFPGTGVGLATVQRIVLRHGGRIWAESAPGKGATFRFTLSP